MLMPVFVWFQLKSWCWNIYIELCVCSPHCGSILAEKTVTCFSDVNLEVGHLVSFTPVHPDWRSVVFVDKWGNLVGKLSNGIAMGPQQPDWTVLFWCFVGSSTEISKKGHIWLLFLLLLTFYTVSFAKTISMGLVLLKERDTPNIFLDL